MMSSAVSILSGGFSPVTIVGAATAFDVLKTWPVIATEASAPLTFMKVRRFMEGLSHFFSLSLSIFILPPFNDCIFYLHYLICECVSDCLNFFLRKDDKGAH